MTRNIMCSYEPKRHFSYYFRNNELIYFIIYEKFINLQRPLASSEFHIQMVLHYDTQFLLRILKESGVPSILNVHFNFDASSHDRFPILIVFVTIE
jgi:hypothetical protein